MSIIKLLASLTERFEGITRAVTRFPVTFFSLVTIAVLNAVSIENQQDYSKQILALVFGVFVFTVSQVLFERFENKVMLRFAFLLGALILTLGCYLIILPAPKINTEISTRNIVVDFALLIAFFWIPSISEKTHFNDVFMVFFKSIFTSVFFSAIIWGGVSLIIAAIDNLLFKIGSNAYSHTINVIWVVWAPMLFLSMIPVFNESETDRERVQKASRCPKFLEVLISYVLIPLTAIYTLVLLLYIAKTIIIRNWNDNLLEPLILSYCIVVLLLYILSSGLVNGFASMFRQVFPKLLVPVALFQMVSSSIIVYTDGIVHTRYFVLMFGLYSVICGVLLSIIPVRKNGVIAALAIAFAFVSIMPPVDAFTVSRTSQMTLLQGTLEKNNMIKGSSIIPNSGIAEKDKIKITKSVEYFNQIGEIKQIKYLPENFDVYADFEKTFGFQPGQGNPNNVAKGKYYFLDSQQPIEIGSYQYLCPTSFNISSDRQENEQSVTKAGEKYRLTVITSNNGGTVKLIDQNNKEILTTELIPMIDSIAKNEMINEKGILPADKMTFDFENGSAKLRIIFKEISIDYSAVGTFSNATVYILFSV